MDFNSALQQKYAIEQQGANARTTTANSEAALADQRANLMPTQVGAEASLQRAQAAHTAAQTGTVAPMADATMRQMGAQTGLMGAQAGLAGAQTGLVQQDLGPMSEALKQALGQAHQFHNSPGGFTPSYQPQQPPAPAHMTSITDKNPDGSLRYPAPSAGGTVMGLASGTSDVGGGRTPSAAEGLYMAHGAQVGPAATQSHDSFLTRTPSDGPGYDVYRGGTPNHIETGRQGGSTPGMASGGIVPGHGSGAQDKVPAVLAPHEAVLNQGAASHLGPHLIDVLNSLGAHKMAMEGNAPQTPPGGRVAMPAGPAKKDGGAKPVAKDEKRTLGKGMPPAKGKKVPGHASGTANVGGNEGGGSGSYDAYLTALQSQVPAPAPAPVPTKSRPTFKEGFGK